MNYNQKRFTVNQVDRYQDQVDSLGKKTKRQEYYLYGCAVLAVLGLGLIDVSEMPRWANILTRVAGWSGISFGISNLKNMISNVAKKAGLENMITDLEYQMNNAELGNQENSHGRGL